MVASYFCWASCIMFSSSATCCRFSWRASSKGTPGAPQASSRRGVDITWSGMCGGRPASSSEASPPAPWPGGVAGAPPAPGHLCAPALRRRRRLALAATNRSSNSSHAPLKPARWTSKRPPDFSRPATARKSDSTGWPASSRGAALSAEGPLQSASSESTSPRPRSGRPSALRRSFFSLSLLHVLPTSRGASLTSPGACSSSSAQGSSPAARATTLAGAPKAGAGAAPSGGGSSSCCSGVVQPPTGVGGARAPPGSASGSGDAWGPSPTGGGSSRSSSCSRSSRSWTSRGGAGTSGAPELPSSRQPPSASSRSSSAASDS
mmetsp:Transcript_31669/g.84729  ORF Transcript_31669/g.84729 Transcript_31669/m.84729 type:complete len:320 (-) Transcript_31669:558-1517(-)